MQKVDQRQNLCYQFVEEYLFTEYNTDLSQQQVKSIARLAFSFYKTSHQLKKSYRASQLALQDREPFIEAVRQVLVSPNSPWTPNLPPLLPNQEIFFQLLQGTMPTFIERSRAKSLLKAIVWEKNLEILEEAKELLQLLFYDLFSDLSYKELTNEESFHFEVIIGDLLALLPFLRPEPGSLVQVPIKMEEQWQLVDYFIEEILLTPNWLGSPCVAYGLISESLAPSLLLFKGTTYPTDRGFSLSLVADTNPLLALGTTLFKIGKNKIEEWLNLQEKEVVIYGKSLGGELALCTATRFCDKVFKVMAYSSPAFPAYSVRKLKKTNHCLPAIHFFSQKGDLIPYLDMPLRHPNIHYYKLSSQRNKNGISAHAYIYSTHPNHTLLEETLVIRKKFWKRVATTSAHRLLSLPLFPSFLAIHLAHTGIRQVRSSLSPPY